MSFMLAVLNQLVVFQLFCVTLKLQWSKQMLILATPAMEEGEGLGVLDIELSHVSFG